MAFTPSLIFGSPSRGLVRAGQVDRLQQFSSFRFSPSASSGKSLKAQQYFGQNIRKIGDSEDYKPSSCLPFANSLPGVCVLEKSQRFDSLRSTFNEVRVNIEQVDCSSETTIPSEERKDNLKLDDKTDSFSKMRATETASCSIIPRKDNGRMKADSKFKRFSSIRSSLKKIKSSVNTGANGVSSNSPGEKCRSIQEIFSPVKSKGHENSSKLETLLSPFKKDEDIISPMKRKEDPELKIRIVDENSDLSDIVKDASTMSGFSSSILAKYRRHRMSLMFEDRCCEHIDLGSDFLMCLES